MSNLGASHLVGLSQRGINNNPNEVLPEDRILAMELALLSFLIPKSQKAILASVLNRITIRYEREHQGLDPDSEYIPIMIPTSVNELRCRFWEGPNSIIRNLPMPQWSIIDRIPILLPSDAIRYLAAMNMYMEALSMGIAAAESGGTATTSSKAKDIIFNALEGYDRKVASLMALLWSDGFQTNALKVNRDTSGAKVITGTFAVPQSKINSTANNTMVLALARMKDDLSTAWRRIMEDIVRMGTPTKRTVYFTLLAENVKVHTKVMAVLQDSPEKREHLGEGAHNGTFTSNADYAGDLRGVHDKLKSCDLCL